MKKYVEETAKIGDMKMFSVLIYFSSSHHEKFRYSSQRMFWVPVISTIFKNIRLKFLLSLYVKI